MSASGRKIKAQPHKATLPVWKKLVYSFCSTLLVLVLMEVVLRGVGFTYTPREKKLWKPTVAGFQGTYEFYIQTRFAPPGYLWISEPDTPYTDRYGFRKPELSYKPAPGKVRIAFLGGSTTQGGYRPYPERAVRLVNQALGTNRYEALNAGCSSYSSHQSLNLFKRAVLDRDPHQVMIYHGWNDCVVSSDGFSDHEKDLPMNVAAGVQQARASGLNKLRLMHFVGKLVDAMDRDWPRPRVSVERVKKNLNEVIALCRARAIPVGVFVRPAWRETPLPLSIGEDIYQYYGRLFGTTNQADLLKQIHARYAAAQEEVAQQSGVSLFDARAVVKQLEDRRLAGEFGEFLRVYQEDGGHLTPFGEELLSQEVALFVAPDEADAIRRYLMKADYWMARAWEFLAENQPHAAFYCAERARALDGDRASDAKEVADRARADFEFAALFEDGRWGGRDTDFESRLSKLKRCLALRPRDVGVVVQLQRVCAYSGKMDRLAAALSGFQPSSREDSYQVLRMILESHLQGRRIEAAVSAARQIMQVNPQDSLAQQLLRDISLQAPIIK